MACMQLYIHAYHMQVDARERERERDEMGGVSEFIDSWKRESNQTNFLPQN